MSGAAGSLPERIPIFPLAGALLLPGGKLPLNIFEPRYLQMTKDAMRTDRVIGMIQPSDPEAADPPPVYRTGCAGRIVEFEETDDGRYLIVLEGVCRFDVVEELTGDDPYRSVIASFRRWVDDLHLEPPEDGARGALLEALRSYLAVRRLSTDWDELERAPLPGLVTALAMVCPFEPSEKQALLEAGDLSSLTGTLTTLLRMNTLDAAVSSGTGGPRH